MTIRFLIHSDFIKFYLFVNPING